MINITDATKAKLKSDSCDKTMTVVVEDVGTFTNEQIWYESFKLEESIINSSWEFVGCISNKMSITVQMPSTTLLESQYKGKKVTVTCKIDTETIPLFVGYIDTAEKASDRSYIKFTAYDALYSKGQTNIYNWYKKLGDYGWTSKGRPLSDIVGELLFFLGIPYDEADFLNLPNPFVKVKNRFKKYKDLTAIEIIEAFCQVNGCFGWIDHSGYMRWKYIATNGNTETVTYYRSLDFDEILVYPLANGVTIRTTKDSSGISVTSSDIPETVDWDDDTDDGYLDSDEDDVKEGSFIIEGNMFAYKLSKKKQKAIACNILSKLLSTDTAFRQYKLELNGLPYLELGDKIKVSCSKVSSGYITFIITNRVLSGIQSMVDTYSASVDETDTTFITEGGGGQTPTTEVKNEYVSTGQTRAIASANAYSNNGETVAKQLASKEVMIVVSWDETTQILETTSELISVQDVATEG